MHLKVAITEYLNYIRVTRSDRSHARYRLPLDDLRKVCPAGLRIDQVKPVHITRYIELCRGRDNAVNTVRTNISLLSGFFHWCIDNEYLKQSPIKKMHKLKEEKTAAYNVITADEFSTLQAVARREKQSLSMTRTMAFLALGYLVGLRKSEIRMIKRSDVDYDKHEIFVKGKGGKEAYLPVSDTVLNILHMADIQAAAIHSKYLICSASGKPLPNSYMHKLFKRLLSQAGLPDYYRIHDLRHSYATNLIRAGVGVAHLKEFMRHADIKTTMRYVHTDKEDLRQIINQIFNKDTNNDKHHD